MIYFLGILISLAVGFFSIRLLIAGRLNLIPHILLGLVFGLGIDGYTVFYTHILFNQFNRFLPVGIVTLVILILYIIQSREQLQLVSLRAKRNNLFKEIASSLKNVPRNDTLLKNTRHNGRIKKYALGLLALCVLAIPLVISAHYYPLGGWDAWSCWNLKAKFIFLGKENWKDMLSPGLWRSNTHYPILWPLINVWFWDLSGRFNQAVPMFNSIVFALLTAGILLFGIFELTGMILPSILAAVVVTALPLGVTLYTSQYSDALLGLFLLSAFISLLLAEKYKLPKLKILSMAFLGLMSFTKNEGLIAACIMALGIFWHERSHKKELKPLLFSFFIAILPTIIFTLFMAPKNEAFINGLTSMEKPASWGRLIVILIYPCFEFISGKWNGFWLLTLGGVLLAGRRLWQSTLGLMGASLILYLAVVMAYYAVNTFFEINWWLSTTLSRILFTLVPTIVLWIGVALLTPAPAKKQ
ncbi:MAG: hypothetical protein HQL12_02585 [Candidatus Omnitrophica bacterium]|nr:hypothetical protein [Candidatus Omnitrophota bacterium]